jgi:hypothetical protein
MHSISLHQIDRVRLVAWHPENSDCLVFLFVGKDEAHTFEVTVFGVCKEEAELIAGSVPHATDHWRYAMPDGWSQRAP